MKTTARTALLGLLVSASLQSLAWADDPNPGATNPFGPSAPAQNYAPAPSPSGFATIPGSPAPSGAQTAGHVAFDSPPANSAPANSAPANGAPASGDNAQPGQVSYD